MDKRSSEGTQTIAMDELSPYDQTPNIYLAPLIRSIFAQGAVLTIILTYLSISATFTVPITIKCRPACDAISAATPITIIIVIAPFSITASHERSNVRLAGNSTGCAKCTDTRPITIIVVIAYLVIRAYSTVGSKSPAKRPVIILFKIVNVIEIVFIIIVQVIEIIFIVIVQVIYIVIVEIVNCICASNPKDEEKED
jgi:hypothetical protein